VSEYPPPGRDPLDPVDPFAPRTGDTLIEPPPPPPPDPPASRFREYLPWALIAILGVLLLGVLGIWYFTRGSDSRAVPAVVGLKIDDAVARLQDDGFRVATQRQSNVRASGTVFGQNPDQDSNAKKGSTVKLLVSSGRHLATVPNAVGRSQSDARGALVAAGFSVVSREVFSGAPTGNVVAQDPAAGARVAPGSRVRLNVSKGSSTVDVPSEVGNTIDQARSELAAKGFVISVVGVPSDQPVDTVVAQSPSGGSVRKGSTVRLNVSKGAPVATTTTDTTTTETTTTSTETQTVTTDTEPLPSTTDTTTTDTTSTTVTNP
jgi:serine/threonine-protein kinase